MGSFVVKQLAMAPYRPSRRTVLKRGALLSGMAVVGSAGFVGSAAASTPEHCPRTPGYWANHFPEGWPQDAEGDLLPVSVCEEYTENGDPSLADLRDYLLMPPRGDKTVIMGKHLIAAKLSLLVSGSGMFDEGCKREIERVAGAAEDWLCEEGGIGSGVRGPWPGDTEEWKDTLDDFNNGEYCDCEEPNG